MVTSQLTPDLKYAELASDEQIERAAQALRDHGIHVMITQNGEEAKQKLFELIPEGAEVFTASSVTLDTLGIPNEVNRRYASVRARLATMNPKTEWREMVKLGAVPEWIVGSVHAVTEDGTIVVASNTGSQLAGYASAAAHVVWIVGAQKIVPTLDEAFRRVREYTLPLEDQRALQVYGRHSAINKWLIIHRETTPERATMIIVKANLGY